LVLMNTSAMIEDLGHEVAEAHSGAEALDLLERSQFDYVITDHAMPRMTGAQLAAEVARRWPQIKIVIATGYAELPTGAELKLPKLSKPFMQDDLARVLAGR
jgi:CheY-like chemotaxis protein